ncbi:MAG: Protein containing Heat shock protein Hsp20 protein [Parcubacteria group bacterium GW2011_GWB1_41_6]|nr:MAG: Protein containing Heat shock protein Hsp20 protein [Parcubacteria group bacterium GW2011_GWB1_41_6]
MTGSVSANDYDEDIEEENPEDEENGQEGDQSEAGTIATKPKRKEWLQSSDEGQLTVDMYQTGNEIIIQSTVAGLKPEEIDVSISQDMVTIRGKRQRMHEISKENYFYQELYWGSFSRSIILPQEVDADSAEANIKEGLLTIRLPKLDKNRVQKIKVKKE